MLKYEGYLVAFVVREMEVYSIGFKNGHIQYIELTEGGIEIATEEIERGGDLFLLKTVQNNWAVIP